MMGGLSSKRGVFLSQMPRFQHIIYGMKDVFFLCLMIYLIPKNDVKKKMLSEKVLFLLLFFDRPYLN